MTIEFSLKKTSRELDEREKGIKQKIKIKIKASQHYTI